MHTVLVLRYSPPDARNVKVRMLADGWSLVTCGSGSLLGPEIAPDMSL